MKVVFTGSNVIPIKDKRKHNNNISTPIQRPLSQDHNIIPYGIFYLNIDKNTNQKPYKYDKRLESYKFARDSFESNIDNKKPMIKDLYNIGKLLSNDKIRRNICEYFVERSEKELSEIKNIDFNNKEEVDKIRGLIQVRDFFNEFLKVWPEETQPNPSNYDYTSGKIAFAGKLTYDDKKHCKNLVHTTSAACAATSAALGEGAALGADTTILRLLQANMFYSMKKYLNVPFIASSEYAFKEFMSGAVLGVEGARIITGWLGVGAHAVSVGTGTTVVSGGGSDVAIAGSVSAVNGVLSGLITEKMGRGYIKRVENNQMNFKNQSVELGSYLLGKGLITGTNPFDKLLDTSVTGAFDSGQLQSAYGEIDKSTKNIFGSFIDILADNSSSKLANYTGKLATYTVLDVGQNLILAKDKSADNMKKIAKESFKNAFLRATVYEICDLAVEDTITQNAQETIAQMTSDLEKYPGVYKVFVKAQDDFINQLNIDNLDDTKFQNQFKNRTFIYNTTELVNGYIKDFSTAWRNRKNSIQAKQILDAQAGILLNQEQNAAINNKIDANEKAETEKLITEMMSQINFTKDLLGAKDNFGYGRIAGYEEQKNILTNNVIMPILMEQKDENSVKIPTVLFYGPTATGKSTLAKSLAEQAQCRVDKVKTTYSEDVVIDKINEKIKVAESIFDESGRHTVLLFDEVDGLNQKPKVLDFLNGYINDSEKSGSVLIFFTTNNLSQVDKSLARSALKIPMGPSSPDDAKLLLQHYLPEDVRRTLNYDKITDQIQTSQQENAYSNAQLERICDNAKINAQKNNRQLNEVDILEQIKEIYPEIAKKDLDTFYSEYDALK